MTPPEGASRMTPRPFQQAGSVTGQSSRKRLVETPEKPGSLNPDQCHVSLVRDTCQSRGSQDNAHKGESTKSFAPFDFLGAPDAAHNPPYCGSQNEIAKSHKPWLESGDAGHRVKPAGSAGN